MSTDMSSSDAVSMVRDPFLTLTMPAAIWASRRRRF